MQKEKEDDGALTVTSGCSSHERSSVSYRDSLTAVQNKKEAETETEPATCSGFRYANMIVMMT